MKPRDAFTRRIIFFLTGPENKKCLRYKRMSALAYRTVYRFRKDVWHYEEKNFELLDKHLNADDVFLDVGANVGYFSLVASDICRKVYSFEPDVALLEILRRSIKVADVNNVNTFQFGLFSSNMFTPFKISRHKVLLEDSPDFALKQSDRNAIDAGDPAFPKIELKRYDELRSDLVPDPVNFIKMDIEGSELHALRGMRETLVENKPKILLAVHPGKIAAFNQNHLTLVSEMREFGYDCRLVSGPDDALSNPDEIYNYQLFCQ